ncbi:N-ATPase subunit AtpR [Yoonia sp. MH D7]
MLNFDYTLFGFGLLSGTVATALYLAGLAWGMRLALRTARPVAVLLPSAAIRITLLIGVGFWISQSGAVALAGFALAFLVVRFVVTNALRPPEGVTVMHPTKEVK